jgi:hypothetical protein
MGDGGIFQIDWDKHIRNLSGGRYCKKRKPGEVIHPVEIGEAIANVEATGARVDEVHAAVFELMQRVDCLQGEILALRRELKK